MSCQSFFPVRNKNFSDFRAVNYEEQTICSPARTSGEKDGIYVYEFLKRTIGQSSWEKNSIMNYV